MIFEFMEEDKAKKNSERGKKARADGQRFEARVRADLEKLGWVVDRWTNTVDYDKEEGIGKVVPAKRKYNPFKKVMVIGTGFPDFICIKNENNVQHVWGVEVKRNGYLDQVEKGMCYWLLTNKIFSRILIAKMKKNGRKIEVEYDDFIEKYGRKMEVKKIIKNNKS
jgi:hypothetical protein